MTIQISTSAWQDAPAPADRPLLAIGDVHGRLDLLHVIHRHLEAEVLPDARAHGTPLVAHLGDYIDRGPDSLGCLLAADAFAPEACETLLLPGNHEQMALDALDGREGIDLWLMNGGTSALAGMDPDAFAEAARGPLARLEGRWLLSHAGVPRRTTPAEVPAMDWRGTPHREDDHPLWVRDAFLGRGQTYPCGTAVLHGHTIARDVEVKPWRVGIDLGAYRTGRLCLAEIREDRIRFHIATSPPRPTDVLPSRAGGHDDRRPAAPLRARVAGAPRMAETSNALPGDRPRRPISARSTFVWVIIPFAFAALLTGALVWIDPTTLRGATGDQAGPLGVLWLIVFGVALREGVRMPWIVRDAMDFGGLRPNARA